MEHKITYRKEPVGSYSDMRDAFFEELYRVAKKDPDVVVLMADQDARTFKKFREEMPSQLVNVGIAEQNMISVASGMARAGKKPFVHAISSFLIFRCYEQIRIDLGLMQAPVVLAGIGAGYAYTSDGATHHSIQDVAVMRAIPGMTIYNAADTASLAMMPHLAHQNPGLTYIRFDKYASTPVYDVATHDFSQGLSRLRLGKDLCLVATGIMTYKALAIAESLKQKGLEVGVIDVYRLKPVNAELLFELIKLCTKVVVLEEHLAYGGLASIVSDAITDNNEHYKFKRIGIADKDCFVYGDRDYMQTKMGLGKDDIVREIMEWHKKTV
jgi:transketolase